MKYSLSFAVTFFVLLGMPGCSSDSGKNSDQAFNYVQPDMSICAVSTEVADGFLCALKPSLIDSATRDVYGVTKADDLAYGFGYHVVAFPRDGTTIQGVLIHFGGSGSRPYDQDTGRLSSKELLLEALSADYIVVQLAYNNRYAINSLNGCGGSNTVIDNCAGDLRREKITGDDVSTVGETPIGDSIEYRLKALVEYLTASGFEFPVSIVHHGEIDWSSVRLGGHSQGAGHALYIKKYLGGGHACLLAGGYDIADSSPGVPTENMADWLIAGSPDIDISSLKALVALDDPAYSYFVSSYSQLGLIKDIHWSSITADPYFDGNGSVIDGHAAPLKDPRFSINRNAACFD